MFRSQYENLKKDNLFSYIRKNKPDSYLVPRYNNEIENGRMPFNNS
jgi:hypothetical protein